MVWYVNYISIKLFKKKFSSHYLTDSLFPSLLTLLRWIWIQLLVISRLFLAHVGESTIRWLDINDFSSHFPLEGKLQESRDFVLFIVLSTMLNTGHMVRPQKIFLGWMDAFMALTSPMDTKAQQRLLLVHSLSTYSLQPHSVWMNEADRPLPGNLRTKETSTDQV